jgi:ureidoglycolate lyase
MQEEEFVPPKREIVAVPLTAQNFEPYGQVIESNTSQSSEQVNLGTAQRYDYVANMKNLRPDTAKPNLCVFHCIPNTFPYKIRMLEKHHFSNQMFSPMNAKRYLVIVCLGEDLPDLSTVGCFIANGTQAINYNPAVWHHPMVALDNETDFTCFVYEDGGDDDCMALYVDWEDITVHDHQ